MHSICYRRSHHRQSHQTPRHMSHATTCCISCTATSHHLPRRQQHYTSDHNIRIEYCHQQSLSCSYCCSFCSFDSWLKMISSKWSDVDGFLRLREDLSSRAFFIDSFFRPLRLSRSLNDCLYGELVKTVACVENLFFVVECGRTGRGLMFVRDTLRFSPFFGV